ncbi:MAG: TPM domain-containing protein [Leptospiraceae bacterium]|nr:TPM domain-containing protein [Leptospiraceae bacterium]
MNQCKTPKAKYPQLRILNLFLGLFLFVIIQTRVLQSQEIQSLVVLNSPVIDLTNSLSQSYIQEISNKILTLQKEKGSQIQVLIVPTTKPEEIEQYSIRLAEAAKIGRKGVDDGVILLVAKNDRRLRIEVGYGLEGVIPDALARRIISEIITPRFKEGNFDQGISEGVDAIANLIRGEELPPPSTTDVFDSDIESRVLEDLTPFQSFLGVIALIIGFIFILGEKYLYAWLSIAVVFLFAGLFGTYTILGLLGFSVLGSLFAVVLLAAIIHGNSSGGGGGGWSSSGGSSSGGGWSGGGGSFGGGGSSGSW